MATVAAIVSTQVAAAVIGAGLLLSVVLVVLYGAYATDRTGRPYEVLTYSHEWDIAASDGSRVVHTKQMHVRFLHDTLVVVDHASGDGTDLYRDYRCSPGYPVDRFRAAHEEWMLISLREQRGRGDTETFEFTRTIVDGFLSADSEWLTVKTVGKTRNVSIRVVFPLGRPCTRATITKSSRGSAKRLGSDAFEQLGGRQILSYRETRPKRGDSYTLAWDWPPSNAR